MRGQTMGHSYPPPEKANLLTKCHHERYNSGRVQGETHTQDRIHSLKET